jgi:hypothetical protein
VSGHDVLLVPNVHFQLPPPVIAYQSDLIRELLPDLTFHLISGSLIIPSASPPGINPLRV